MLTDLIEYLDDKLLGLGSSNMLLPQKANIMFLSREISNSDHTIRSKMVVANIEGEEKAGECVWEQNDYFGEINPDFSIHKKNFPENALVYIIQAYLTVKDRDVSIYCDYVILGQIVVFRNPPEDIDELIKAGKSKALVKMYMAMYDNTTGQFWLVRETLGYIMLRNEPEETFLTCGFSSEHSAILFCYSKQPMPNIFRGTSFNTHKLQTFLENKAKKSDLSFYFPSITDRKESINRYKDQVSLVHVTSSINDINEFSPEGYVFDPKHLDQSGKDCENARATLYSYCQNVCNVSNANLIQNVYALIKEKNIDHARLKWALSMPQAKVNYSKFSLSFS